MGAGEVGVVLAGVGRVWRRGSAFCTGAKACLFHASLRTRASYERLASSIDEVASGRRRENAERRKREEARRESANEKIIPFLFRFILLNLFPQATASVMSLERKSR